MVTGFAEGFGQGFGLMQSTLDARDKRKRLDAAEQLAQDQFGLEQEKQADLRAYREEDLDIKRTSEATRGLQAQTAALNAQTANLKARTAQQIADDKNDPDSLEGQKIASEIAENLAQGGYYDAQEAKADASTRYYEAGADQRKQAVDMYRGAQFVQQAWDLTDPNALASTSDLTRLNQLVDATTNYGIFDLSYIASSESQVADANLSTFMQDLAAGGQPDLDGKTLRAMSHALGINSSAAVGRNIDETFVNAPAGLKDGNWEVSSQGLRTLTAGEDGTLTGSLYVMAKHKTTGEEIPYFPPLTAARSFQSNERAELNIDDGMKAIAGSMYMRQNLRPRIREKVTQARILTQYGDNKGDNGVTKFEKVVNKIVQDQIKHIEDGGQTDGLAGTTLLPSGEVDRNATVTLAGRDKMRQAVKDKLLFPEATVQPDADQINKWLEQSKNILMRAQVSDGVRKRSLAEIVGEENFTPQAISALSFYVSDTGEVENQKALVSELKRLKFL
tara:strand:+ start:524 stop:2035 length:1512 start_codon:yes stop_codon:yes gene_type:complete